MMADTGFQKGIFTQIPHLQALISADFMGKLHRVFRRQCKNTSIFRSHQSKFGELVKKQFGVTDI